MKIKNQTLFYVNSLPVNIDIDLDQQNGIYLLTGENGVGKSSLLNHFKIHRSLFLEKKCAFMDQFPLTPINEIRVKDVLDLFEDGIADFDKARALSLFNRYGLDYIIDRSISLLSGGENQLLKFIFLLGQEADIYFLDEPLQYIDEKRLALLLEDIKKLSYSKCLLIVEHRSSLFENLELAQIQMQRNEQEIIVSGI